MAGIDDTGGRSRWPVFSDLAGKVAVVTGGSRGLGAEACRALSANGVKVAVNGRDTKAIDKVVREVSEAGGTALAAPADCTDFSALAALSHRVEDQLGSVGVLLRFAGGGRQPRPVSEIDIHEWHADIEQNLTATFLTVKAFLPAMTARRSGSIITMASVLPGSPAAHLSPTRRPRPASSCSPNRRPRKPGPAGCG